MKLLTFVIALCSVAEIVSQSNLRSAPAASVSLPKGNALNVMENMVKVLSSQTGKEADSLDLPKGFRDENGNFIPATFTQATPAAPVVCTDLGELGALYSSGSADVLTYSYYFGTSTLTGFSDDFFHAPYVTQHTTACVYMKGAFEDIAINVNRDGSDALIKSIPIKSVGGIALEGVSCANCYAQVAADMELSMKCVVDVGFTNSASCSFSFTSTGATSYNFDLAIEDPVLTFSPDIISLLNISEPIPIFNSAEVGLPVPLITIGAAPQLSVQFLGGISGQGSGDFATSFRGNGGIQDSISMTGSVGSIKGSALSGFGFDSDLVAPNYSGELQVKAPFDLTFVGYPTVEWTISLGITGCSLDFVFITPVSGSYHVTQTSSDAACGNVVALGTSLSLDSISFNAFNIPFDMLKSPGIVGAPFTVPVTLPTNASFCPPLAV